MSASTFKTAWREEDTVIYIDAYNNKHTAKGGNLTWRINNPGLIHHHSPVAKKNGSIGAWEQFSIFSNPLQGHQALREWLHSEKFYQSDLYAIGKHYQPLDPAIFAENLAATANIPPKTKLKGLTKDEFETLLFAIEKLCGFTQTGSEEFGILPKILGKIERQGTEDLYLLGNDLTLTKNEVVSWVATQRLDAVVVHTTNGTHIRSRPDYHMQNLQLTLEQHNEIAGVIDPLIRVVGEKAPHQCVWGFINGIFNTKDDALESCSKLSKKAGNELVFSFVNDSRLMGITDIGVAVTLKLGIDSPIVKKAVSFLKYLIALAETDKNNPPIIVFAHSQGAAITKHAIRLLNQEERQKIRIFTFGGWSFITPGLTHSDSHNYITTEDIIPRLGSRTLQYVAMRKYEGLREGLNEKDIISRLALEDALHHIDSLNPQIREKYVKERCQFYIELFNEIENITVISSDIFLEHSFNNENYQNIVALIIEKYRNTSRNIAITNSEKFFVKTGAA